MSHPTVEELAGVDLFSELDERQLAVWAEVATIEEVPEGTIVAEQGSDSPGLTIVLEGTIEALAVDGAQIERVGDHIGPTWMGAIATLTDGPVGVRMRAGTALRLANVPPADFVELAIAHRCVFRRVMNQVRPVVERISAIGQNRERLESLGTMAAGLAHELNNPAAAARRTLGGARRGAGGAQLDDRAVRRSGLERTDASSRPDAARGARLAAPWRTGAARWTQPTPRTS